MHKNLYKLASASGCSPVNWMKNKRKTHEIDRINIVVLLASEKMLQR